MIVFEPMKYPDLFSVRMRASSKGVHVSGGERIVSQPVLKQVAANLIARAFSFGQDIPDDVSCRVERIDKKTLSFAKLPPISTYRVKDYLQGQLAALQLLSQCGICSRVATQALELLTEGPGPEGQVMRGAVIMDCSTGERLEHDCSRGVRVSRMDIAEEFRESFISQLRERNLGHPRTVEAVILAGKVLTAPGIIAELCWSDDPEYTSGYVATCTEGYQRIVPLKQEGNKIGGRVFFFDSNETSLQTLVSYLENQTILFNQSGEIKPAVDWSYNDG